MRLRIRGISFTIIAAVIGQIVSGCVPLKSDRDYQMKGVPASAFMPSDIAEFISLSQANVSAAFLQTPWGENVTLTTHIPYYSASGVQCRELSIQRASTAGRALVCSNDQQRWYQVRVLPSE